MCNLSTAIKREGLAEGILEGRVEGRVEGVDLMARLVKILASEKRFDDIEKVSEDKNYREKLMREYNPVEG